MKRLVIGLVAMVLAGTAFAGDVSHARAAANDHSAFFNGAGSQHDNVPVTRVPTSRVTFHSGGDHGHHHPPPAVCYPRRGHHVNFWVSPVRREWIPGHYEWRAQQVWVDATWTTEYVPPVYQYGYEGSRQIRILVQEGYYRRVQIPGHYETRQIQVWVEGYWNYY